MRKMFDTKTTRMEKVSKDSNMFFRNSAPIQSSRDKDKKLGESEQEDDEILA